MDYITAHPQLLAEGIVSLASTATAGLIIAFVATFYLKQGKYLENFPLLKRKSRQRLLSFE